MKKPLFPCALLLLLAATALPPSPLLATEQKVLRYAFAVAETGFDPAQVSDLYSNILNAHMFDSPLQYDYLARPIKLKPNTAAAMPEVAADGKTITVRIKPGILFADDPAFGGKKRELTAHDYVYSIKRHYDPRWKSSSLTSFEDYLVGMPPLREEALRTQRFDYDREVEGVRALDRYTFQLKLMKPSFTMIYVLTDCRATCALAREVVESYGDKIAEHPVGTGPYRLSAWTRSSKMVFTKNPNYREEIFETEPPADDPAAQEIARRLAGKRLPMIDRVEISIIEESQPRWLAFLNAEHDLIEGVPNDYANIAFPNDKLAAYLAKRGIRMDRYPRLDVAYTYFNWTDPIVGGPEPHKVALRRAIGLGYDTPSEIRIARKNQAIFAQAPIYPGANGYDPQLRTEMSEYHPAKARALLDLYGYTDRDGDGYRELPDGRPLVLEYATTPGQTAQPMNELWKKNMDAIGIRLAFKKARWPELLKASRAGKLQMWGLGSAAAAPDAEDILSGLYGPYAGKSNLSRFDLPAYNDLFRRMVSLPLGPERNALTQEMVRLIVAYMPWKTHAHRIGTDLVHPWVIGWKAHPVMRRRWNFMDVDTGTAAGSGS